MGNNKDSGDFKPWQRILALICLFFVVGLVLYLISLLIRGGSPEQFFVIIAGIIFFSIIMYAIILVKRLTKR